MRADSAEDDTTRLGHYYIRTLSLVLVLRHPTYRHGLFFPFPHADSHQSLQYKVTEVAVSESKGKLTR
jgi:hypothetical protein